MPGQLLVSVLAGKNITAAGGCINRSSCCIVGDFAVIECRSAIGVEGDNGAKGVIPILDNKSNMLVYEGRYYLIGKSHKEFLPDKIRDEDYYLLTLVAIAKELKPRSLSRHILSLQPAFR